MLIGPKTWIITPADYITSIFLIPSLITSSLLHLVDTRWVDGVYWRLWVEVRFYVLAAIVYSIAGKRFVGAWLVLQMVVVGLQAWNFIEPTKVIESVLENAFFKSYFPFFTLGICVYEIRADGALRNLAIAGIFASFIILMGFIALRLYNYDGPDFRAYSIAVSAIFALFVLFAIDHPVLTAFTAPPLVHLGRASYSLYLVHQRIGISLMCVAVTFGLPYLVALPLVAGLMIGLAMLLFKFVEKPSKASLLRKSQNVLARIERSMPKLRYHAGNHEAGAPISRNSGDTGRNP